MRIIELQLNHLQEAPWNPNHMDETMLGHLKESLSRYGLVSPLIVRPISELAYEVLSGNQRLRAIRDLGFKVAPYVTVNVSDGEAMLLAQALNGLRGEDDLAMKSDVLKKILSTIPENEVLSLLPETTESLKALTSIGETDLAEQLQAWEQAQSARLRHFQAQLTDRQMETVEEAVSLILPRAKDSGFDNPNSRGNAVFLLCKFYLERRQSE